MTTAIDEINETAQRAEAAVAAFEAVPMGEAWADQAAAASAAVGDLHRAARPILFPAEIPQVDQPVHSTFGMLEQSFSDSRSRYASGVIDAHARSIDSYPTFATFLRSPMVMSRLHQAIEATELTGRGRITPEELAELVGPVERALAGHLRGREAFEPAATAFMSVQALAGRVDASRLAREEFVRAEVERANAERLVADEVTAGAEAELRRELASFFMSRSGRVFNLRGGYVLSGVGAAAVAMGQSARDAIDQAFVTSQPLAELERLRVETEAAEAAGQR